MIKFKRGTDEVSLRHPVLGNTQTLKMGVRYHRMMSGAFYTYCREVIPSVLTLTFRHLTKTDIDNFEAFLQAVRGQSVTYTDPAGANWTGYLTNTPNSRTNESLNSTSMTVIFEGTKNA